MGKSDLEAQFGPEPARRSPPPSLEESRRFARALQAAVPGPNGLFQLAQIDKADQGGRWAYRMCEERDCSQLLDRAAGEIDELEATIVDRAVYAQRDRAGETTASYRTVAAFARSQGRRRLLALRRQEERKGGETASSADSVIDEYLAIVDGRGLKHVNRPLLSVEPEVADPNQRRLLVRRRIPYAILLDPDHPFRNVHRTLDENDDVLEYITVECVFDCLKPKRDRTRSSHLEASDLRESPEVRARKVREHLFEIPINGRLEYFVVWPGVRRMGGPGDRLRAARGLAEMAADVLLDRPSDGLRMREFHHPHDGRYYDALRIADLGRRHP